MNYRSTELLSATDLGASGTKTIDVNIADPISRLDFLFKVTKSKHGMNSYTHKNISKLELVDGSDILFSMDGGQAQALGIYDRRAPTMQHGNHTSGDGEFDIYPMDFGRFLWDPVLALDPKRFKNLQLKITWDEDVADTGATENEALVIAHTFDEKTVSPMGCLMSKSHWQSALGADGTYHYIELPTDYPLRQLLVQGYLAAYEPWYSIEAIRLSEDNLKKVVWDYNTERYYRMMKGVWAPVREFFYGVGSVAGTYAFYVTPTDYFATMIGNQVGGAGYGGPSGNARGGYFVLVGSATAWIQGIATGYLPNHCVQFPFGDQNDPSDWYDVTKKGSVQLRLESGTAGTSGTGAVILQQLRKY